MKTLLRIAAVLSFGFFCVGGLVFLGMALPSTARDAWPMAVVGLTLIGTAFFVGPILLFAAERLGPKDDGR